jgi:hypothetical protein
MLKIGAVVLTISAGFNLLLAAAILVAIIALGKNPPILYVSLDQAEVAQLPEQVLATFKSLAIYFNSAIVTFCLLSIFVIWAALSQGHKWAFWALFITMGLSQILAFVADSFIGNKTFVVNIVLTAIYLSGIALSWFGLRAN